MGHGPSTDWGKDNAAGYKTKLGIIMFIIYGIVYAGFIAITTIIPEKLSITIPSGLNLAVIYGFGLIILAVIFGVIYNFLCTRKENQLNDNEGDKK